MRQRRTNSVGLLLALVIGGCGREPQPPELDRLVALVGDRRLETRDVEEEIAHRAPGFRQKQYAAAAKREELLESMVRFELLVAEAHRRGYANHPEVLRAVRQEMVAVMLRKEIDDRLSPKDVPSAEIEQRYQARASEFKIPEQVRVAQILVTDEAVARQVASLAGRLKRRDPAEDRAAFAQLVTRYSRDAASRARAGEVGTLTAASTDQPAEVVKAALALREPGELSAVVRSPRGYHVLKLLQRTAAMQRSLADVRPTLVQDVLGTRRSQRIEELVSSSRARTSVQVFKQRLADVRIAE